MVNTEHFKTTTTDGVQLGGLLLIPPKPKAVVQFNCGTGAKKEFYLPFLTFLAENGYACCLWDYRGSGSSAPADMAHCTYHYHEYGTQDMPAILRFLRSRYPQLPLFVVAHSAGGQQVALMPSHHGIHGLVAFAVSTGYMRRMPLAYRLKTMFFFYLFTPVSIWLTGYLKAKKFGLMEDLPRNIVRDWRDWCEEEAYFFHPKFKEKKLKNIEIQSFNFPVAIFTASDDTISTPRNIASFWKRIKNNKKTEFIELSPEKYGVFQIGHMGVFRRKFKDTIWQEALAKLNAMWLQTGD